MLESQPIVPQKFVKHILGSTGIYEARASVGSTKKCIMGANKTITAKNITTLDQHLGQSYGEHGTMERETFHANAFSAYVGAIVQDYREQNNLTQQELSDRLGVKKSYLSRIENGRADIRLSTLARVLGCMGFDLVATPRK